ncbi:hypothetical protein [Candidatus Hodarchaeum mangrovi]
MKAFLKIILLLGLILFNSINGISNTRCSNALILEFTTSLNSLRLNKGEGILGQYNQYIPDGNSSVIIIIDSNLIGEGKYFADYSIAKSRFEMWLEPFENTFMIKFNIKNITEYTPGPEDSLYNSLDNVTRIFDWKLGSGIDDSNNEGNYYDWMIIYQEKYNGGRNHANSIWGNVLIISHNQPLNWVSQQLILLHEIGHIFGAEHQNEGEIPPDWYGGANYSLMSYQDLSLLHLLGWDKTRIPIDKHNFDIINSSKFRFDQIDADLDNLPNWYEYRYNFDSTTPDSTYDSDDDGLTNLEEYTLGSNPLMSDTDKDGYSDWAESLFGTSPINSTEIPIIDIPIIYPWMYSSTLTINDSVYIKWRALSSYPSHYIIYRNNTQIIQNIWNSEVIEYKEVNKAGNWNFTCVVFDTKQQFSVSTVIVEITKPNSTTHPFLVFYISIFIFLIYIRRKKNLN